MKAAHLAKKNAFLHSENIEAPNRKTKRNSKADKATIAIVRSIQKLGCASHDVEALPEPAIGPTNVRRSLLKKSGKSSARTHRSLKGGATNRWGSNAPTFAERDPTYTFFAEDDAR